MRLRVLLAAVGVVIAACGNSSEPAAGPADPASATTCAELADAIVATNQELIDQVDDMSVEALAAAGGPLSFEEWVAKAQLGASQVAALGCGDVLEGMLAERAGRLHANGPAGESLIVDFVGNVSGN